MDSLGCSLADGFGMDADGIVYIPCISTSHDNRNRNSGLMTGVKHELVTLSKAYLRQCKPAEAVIMIRISASQVNHQITSEFINTFHQTDLQGLKVCIIGGAILQFDIQIAWHLMEWKVARPMD